VTGVPTNTAAWLPAKHARLQAGAAPYTSPDEGEIVVENHAVAINPLDWILQLVGNVIFRWIRYPFVLGADLAGEVVEVGAGVSRFQVGDRVLAHAVGTDKKRNRAAEGSFQRYTVVLAHLTAPIPDTMAYEDAAVLPLGLSTAACGLFQADHLALTHPSASPVPTGQTVLVWGGSTSVGSNAIQLAVAAGYDVVTTASPKNNDYVTGLGASRVFDYRAPTVVEEIVQALAGTTLAGAIAVGAGSADPCLDIVGRCEGPKLLSTASTAVSFDGLPDRPGRELVPLLLRLSAASAATAIRSRRRRVRMKSIFGSTLMDNEVGEAIYVDFLPAALADGRYVAAPPPHVVGTGLEDIQAALDLQKRGMSASKVVVRL